jgi:Domain of unknown function (DUF4157)
MNRSLNFARSSPLQRKCSCGGGPSLSAECDECRENHLALRRRTPDAKREPAIGSPVPPIVHDVLRSPGQPIEPETRAFFESRFRHDFNRLPAFANGSPPAKLTIGASDSHLEQEAERIAEQVVNRSAIPANRGHDFSRVRIHADDRAVKSARSINALAYTVGRNIVFDQGQYQPNTRAGAKLIAHELAHVRGTASDSSCICGSRDDCAATTTSAVRLD